MLSTYRQIIVLIPLLLMLSLSSAVVAARPVIKVAVPEDFPPFYYKDSDGRFKGVSYEVAAHICDQLGYDIEVTQMPSMRLMLAALKEGYQDLSINLTATEARSELAYFTQTPHVFESQHLIVRADSRIDFDGDVEKLAEYRFGPIFGWTYGPKFDRASHLNKEFVNDSMQQLKGLLSGRYDIAMNNPQYFLETASSMGVASAFRLLEPAVFTLPVTMAVSRQHPDAQNLVQALERELALFVQQDAYQDILERYGFTLQQDLAEEAP